MLLRHGPTARAARGLDAWEMLYLNDVFIRRPASHRLRHVHHRTIFLDTHNFDGNRNSLSSENGRVQNLRVLHEGEEDMSTSRLTQGAVARGVSKRPPTSVLILQWKTLSVPQAPLTYSTAHQLFSIVAQSWLKLHGVGDCLFSELFNMLNTAFILVPN